VAKFKIRAQMTPKEDQGRGRGTTPARMGQTTPPVYPSGDYTYVLEIVMGMQGTMRKLTEAVESLKAQSKTQGEKVDQIGKDMHAAKVVVGFIGGSIVVTAGFLGWAINAFLQYLSSHPHT
jgi:hypothetical protein